MKNLRGKIEDAINKASAENVSNTPDFILAEYLVDCLAAFDKATNARIKWYDKEKEDPTETNKVVDIKEVCSDAVESEAKKDADDIMITTINKIANEANKKVPTTPVLPQEVAKLKIDTTNSVANPLYAKKSQGYGDLFKGTSWGNK